MQLFLCQKFGLWLAASLTAFAAVIGWNLITWDWDWGLTTIGTLVLSFACGYSLSVVVRYKEVLRTKGCSVFQCLRRERVSREIPGR